MTHIPRTGIRCKELIPNLGNRGKAEAGSGLQDQNPILILSGLAGIEDKGTTNLLLANLISSCNFCLYF
jgi:hypothetical protein